MTQPVVLVPPLLMPRHVMRVRLAPALRSAGREPVIFGYPSYRWTIPESGAKLARFLAERTGRRPYDIVTFSMGAIVLRWAVCREGAPAPRRVVMLAPPNQGLAIVRIACRMLTQPVFRTIWGRSAVLLQPQGELIQCLGAWPRDVELGIIAAGSGRRRLYNPLLAEDNDRLITLSETWVEGARDWVAVRSGHGTLVFLQRAAGLAEGFLRNGCFPERGDIAPPPHVAAALASTPPVG